MADIRSNLPPTYIQFPTVAHEDENTNYVQPSAEVGRTTSFSDQADSAYSSSNYQSGVDSGSSTLSPIQQAASVIDHKPVKNVVGDANVDDDDDYDDEHSSDTKCSFFGWQPKFLQYLANIKVFVACLIVKGTLLGMLHSYHSGIISTIEKRFRLPSSMIGTIGSIGEIGELTTIFFVAHYGGSGHRPRWLAAGTFILALAAALSALPELFAPPNDLVNWTPANTTTFYSNHTVSVKSKKIDIEMCRWNASSSLLVNNQTRDTHKKCSENVEDQNLSTKNSLRHKVAVKLSYIPSESRVAFALFTIAALLQNVAASFGLTLTLPYIHDNVDVRNSPMYYSIMIVGRIGGPLVGNALSSAFTAMWIRPFKGPPPGLTGRDDPRWIGAWYFGFIIAAVGLAITSLILSMFPRRMPRRRPPAVDTEKVEMKTIAEKQQDLAIVDANSANVVDAPHNDSVGEPVALASDLKPSASEKNSVQSAKKNFKQLPKDLLRVILNVTVMARALAGAFDAFIYAGFAKFLMKYAEVNFRYPAYIANMVIGFSGLIPVAFGSLLGAYLIRRFNMQPRHIAFCMFATHAIVCVGSVGMALFSCGSGRIAGLDFAHMPAASTPPPKFSTLSEYLQLPPYANCSNGPHGNSRHTCHCKQRDFNPVCDLATGLTYFSPCYAGCTQLVDPLVDKRYSNATSKLGNEVKLYSNCSCAAEQWSASVHPHNSTTHKHSNRHALYDALPEHSRVMKSGRCEGPCKALFGYVALKIVLAITMSLPISGSIMILYRIVDPDLKSMAQGVQSFLSSAIAFAPAPIIVGAIFDASCRLWNTRTDHCTGATSLGNCLLYDTNKLRWLYHLLPAGVRVLSTICDFVVFLKVRHLTFDNVNGKKKNAATAGDN